MIGSTRSLDSLSISGVNLALPVISTTSLAVNFSGTLTQSGAANVTGAADLVATGSITLGNFSIGNSIRARTDVATGQISVTGPITATGSAPLTLTGRNISVTGNITSRAGVGGVINTQPGRVFVLTTWRHGFHRW